MILSWFQSGDEEPPGDEEQPSDEKQRSDEKNPSDEEQPSDDTDEEGPSHASRSFAPKQVSHLELSIHEICHYRVGPALWTYREDSDKRDLDNLKPLRSPTDILGITFDKHCMVQIKLFAVKFDHERYRHLLIDEDEVHDQMRSTAGTGLFIQ
jgi:hypothetical protein